MNGIVNQGAFVGGFTLAQGVQVALPPRTVASAAGSMGELNGRLQEMLAMANNIAERVGGPYPASQETKGQTPATGIVGELNDAVSHGHDLVSEIRGVLDSIGRQLG